MQNGVSIWCSQVWGSPGVWVGILWSLTFIRCNSANNIMWRKNDNKRSRVSIMGPGMEHFHLEIIQWKYWIFYFWNEHLYFLTQAVRFIETFPKWSRFHKCRGVFKGWTLGTVPHWAPKGTPIFGDLYAQGALIHGGSLGTKGALLKFWSHTKQNLLAPSDLGAWWL